MALKRSLLKYGIGTFGALVALFCFLAPTQAQTTYSQVQHVIPAPTPTTFPATATPAPNTYSYTFDGGIHAYTHSAAIWRVSTERRQLRRIWHSIR